MDYKHFKANDPARPAWLAGIAAAAAIIALTSWMSNRDIEQRREIARLSLTCPATQSGQELIATVRNELRPGSLQCIYTTRSVYGSKPARKIVVASE